MTTSVSGTRAGGATPTPDELAEVQNAAPSPRSTPTTRTVNTQGSNIVTQAPSLPPGANSPREFPTGTMDYYRKRHFDFVARNPGTPPPPYYLQYGDKYIKAFKALGPDQLSPKGLEWRDKALKNLQQEMEDARRARPEDFATLERNPEKFKEFAYVTHVDAYVNAGLLELPTQDLLTILSTPDLQDILDEDGLKQILEVIGKVKPQSVVDILSATASEEVRRRVQPPLAQMEQELKSLMLNQLLNNAHP
ncbi:hypothetical protein JQX13_03540 [Archangium violaceum]|uniref:hypothetical protein n=1 Tax=Archangium violaceum TaxID=83451 RepID=UPI00193BDFE5|nr:hypothetical protein [Archangium violaceum]QRK09242.1 hypothetical protein JQX13_03540 [Archangium violaceum]